LNRRSGFARIQQLGLLRICGEGNAIHSRLRKFVVSGCATIVVALVPAASPVFGGEQERPAPAVEPSQVDADLDQDGIFEDLEARLGRLGPNERVSVLVRLALPATDARISTFEQSLGAFPVSRLFSLVQAFAASLTKGQINALARFPAVVHVEENSRMHVLNDTAQASFGVTAARTEAPALDGGDGVAAYSKDDLVTAVIDTGIDPGHLDLDEGKVLHFVDCVDETCADAAAFDDHGHGTHVAATIAGDGEARADRLYKGVAPEGALVGVKVLAGNGSGTDAGVVAGIQWAVANKDVYGIEVLNLSLGGDGCSNGTDLVSAAVNEAHDAGLVVAVAAGNEGPGTCTVSSPAAAAKALTVGAMRDFGANGFNLAYFSSRGPTLDGRTKPDVAAPGFNVTSADAGTASGYVAMSGTSMATPFVAGVAALMLEAGLSPGSVKAKIMETAVDWGPAGIDHEFGAGRLDAHAALQAAGASLGTAPSMPSHRHYAGNLAATGATADYLLNVTDTQFPIAATLIMPGITGGSASSPDFDLRLYSPSGSQLLYVWSTRRQEELGYKPTVAGTYRLRIESYRGGGAYWLDVSYGSAPDTTAPAAPTALTASPGNGQVVLDWANNSDADLAGYRVYRSSAGGPFSLVASPTASAQTDTGLTNGVNYSYYVTAVDSNAPPNESAPSATASATPVPPPPAPTVKSYNPAGYTIAAGSVYNSTGAVSRLYTNDGSRVEINSASGSPRVSELQPYATVTAAELATLSKLTVNFDAGVSSTGASLSFRVCRWDGGSTCTWETVASYGTGSTSDRSFTWSTATPAAYASPAGELRVSVRGTRNSSSFRTRTDWIRFTIEY
jgi:serine protease AprX